MSLSVSQGVSKDTQKTSVHPVIWGFFVSGRPETVLALQAFLLISWVVSHLRATGDGCQFASRRFVTVVALEAGRFSTRQKPRRLYA
jgi:hypothetical protein